MKYRQHTKRLGIPVLGYRDKILPEVEMEKWQLVENILMSVMGDNRSFVFSEGDFALEKQQDGTYTAVLRAIDGNTPSFSGVIGGVFVETPSVIRWDGLSGGSKYYLYLHSTRKTVGSPSAIRLSISKFNVTGRGKILVGIANLTGDDYSIDRHPQGKRYSSSLSVPGLALSPQVVDFVTGGVDGKLLEVGGRITFVCCSMTDNGAGDVWFGYHGSDENVLRYNQVMVYNSGAPGILAKAMIFCE